MDSLKKIFKVGAGISAVAAAGGDLSVLDEPVIVGFDAIIVDALTLTKSTEPSHMADKPSSLARKKATDALFRFRRRKGNEDVSVVVEGDRVAARYAGRWYRAKYMGPARQADTFLIRFGSHDCFHRSICGQDDLVATSLDNIRTRSGALLRDEASGKKGELKVLPRAPLLVPETKEQKDAEKQAKKKAKKEAAAQAKANRKAKRAAAREKLLAEQQRERERLAAQKEAWKKNRERAREARRIEKEAKMRQRAYDRSPAGIKEAIRKSKQLEEQRLYYKDLSYCQYLGEPAPRAPWN